jgi:predicted nucleic acid-binding protein
MKAKLGTMLWVSYCTRPDGSRHRLIDRALKAKVRLFVSDYILDELAEVLREELQESPPILWAGFANRTGRF